MILDRLASEHWSSFCRLPLPPFPLLSIKFYDYRCAPLCPAFMWVLGIWTQVLMPPHQGLHTWNHPSSPYIWNLKVLLYSRLQSKVNYNYVFYLTQHLWSYCNCNRNYCNFHRNFIKLCMINFEIYFPFWLTTFYLLIFFCSAGYTTHDLMLWPYHSRTV